MRFDDNDIPSSSCAFTAQGAWGSVKTRFGV